MSTFVIRSILLPLIIHAWGNVTKQCRSQVMYSRMEEADALIDDLSRDKDPNLRICGMYTVAMAYCGTGNNKAIKQLLHVAVSRCLYTKNIYLFF